MANRTTVFVKDKESILDYTIDWSQWLPVGDTIVVSAWTVPDDIAVESDTFTTTTTTVWLSGAGPEGTRSTVTNHITTADGREEDFSFVIISKEK